MTGDLRRRIESRRNERAAAETARSLPPLTDAQCARVAALLSLSLSVRRAREREGARP